MKKLKKWLIFSMSLVVLCLGYFTVRHYIIHNIFDEIYYNQKNSLGTPALERIEGVSNPAGREPTGDQISEVYDLDNLPSGITDIDFSFNFSEEYGNNTQFTIVIKQVLADDSIEVTTSYNYHSKTKTLDRVLWVKDETSGLTSNKEDVINVLEKKGTTYKKFTKKSDNILKSIVLKDWCSVYHSRYSPDDWGDVTVKSRWED
ncbi:hypothetical protein SAMN05660328_101224 [Streptococcus gallolyticus]|uniref:Signal peptide containing protein n=1 Tax=Streptococcus gallolyticus TaxID=315405 RepID=A0A1I7F6H6_9STRE|nr:TipC family immunity protein [Streptococcus gallolyticus]SFC02636.1 hypothetical protein SAMN02983012_0370 [Streptococcus gallolyticus]SFU31792.1 hypothetical protein SAMN05660328_101224 [Streptococcus gallolyticus]